MIIVIRRSKTIQFSERVFEIPVARCQNTELCAVHWTGLHFQQIPTTPGSIAFRIPGERGAPAPLPYGWYQTTLRIFAEKAGLDPSSVSSHSLRRGGCTYLSLCRVTIEELQTRGDWATDTVFTYLKTPLTIRIMNDIHVATTIATTDT